MEKPQYQKPENQKPAIKPTLAAANKKQLVVIVGGGKVGAHLAALLRSQATRVTLVENQPAHAAELRRTLAPVDQPGADTIVVEGSGSDPDVLERAGVRHAAVVAAVTGSDETNLVVTSLARLEFHAPRTIARINNPKNAWLFTPEMGVDVAVDQAGLIGKLIAEEMSLDDVVTLLKLRSGRFSLVEEKVHPQAPAAGRAIRDLSLPAQCVICALIRQGRLIIPRGDTVLHAGDEVLALVASDVVARLADLLGPAVSHAPPLSL
jgi:trk system potassium uptake protein TrkA